MNFRECGDCTACCNGTLIGEAHGHKFGYGKPCIYLSQQGCSIYEDRPEGCKKYQCAWTQHLFPDWMQPNKCGAMISVEQENGGQFLKVTELRENVDEAVYEEINRFCKENSTYYRVIPFHKPEIPEGTESTKPTAGLEMFINPLMKMGKHKLVKEVLDCYASISNNFFQFENLGRCYFENKNHEESMICLEQAYRMGSKDLGDQIEAALLVNLINVCSNANYPEKALSYIDLFERKFKSDVEMTMHKSFAYFLNNEKPKAESILRNLLNTNPNLTDEEKTRIKFNLGNYHLYRDEYLEGMNLFLNEGGKLDIWKKEASFLKDNPLEGKILKWDGTTIPGATIICNAEAGLGDEIVNFRFTKLIESRGMKPVWFNSLSNDDAQVSLRKVFKRHGLQVISSIDELDVTENLYYVQSMHISVIMKLGYADFWSGPYLHADSNYVKKWEETLHKDNGRLKIAVRWQGNPGYEQNLHRSVPLSEIYEVLKNVDADFFSVQKDTGLEELSEFPGLVDLSKDLKSWEDTLAVLENMDIVVTSCTSVAHAAAAMGKKTFIFVPISAYYTWSHSMEQSPWYGNNVTLLRQSLPRSWAAPLKKLKGLLP